MNKTASLEWLIIAYHDLRSAQILYEVLEFTEELFEKVCKTLDIKSSEVKGDR